MIEFINSINGKKILVKIRDKETAFVNNILKNYSIIKTEEKQYSLLYENRVYNCVLIHSNNNQYEIYLNNKNYLVECKTSLESIENNFSKSDSNSNNAVTFSPMHGLILKILKKDGDVVKKGETILILEAMKMENEIVSPLDGKLNLLGIKEGITVEKNSKLFEIFSLIFDKK
jgi:biotin carboxyl carrier protein